MSRRRIGRESFGFGDHGRACRTTLNALSGVIDRVPVERSLADISSAAKGEPAWPPLALFKATLLSIWYDLSGRQARRSAGRSLFVAKAAVQIRFTAIAYNFKRTVSILAAAA
jgi:hypothetical protein